jgi:flavin reductase (DIM6/NTAB) family NADH-FMN oxidoreductase RutF
MDQHYLSEDLQAMPRVRRIHFVNTLLGYRGAHLIGTESHRGVPNLALFNSVVHIGASPAVLGFFIRPLTIPRHTYHNIKAKGHFTINVINEDIFPAAHQTSADYPEGVSEFEVCGLTPWYSEAIAAPYVAECAIKIGLRYLEEHWIKANETILIVGEVVEIFLPDGVVEESGHVSHEALGTTAVLGLDTYYAGKRLARLAYARPGEPPRELTPGKTS